MNNPFSDENPRNIALTIDVPPSATREDNQDDQEGGVVDENSAMSALTSSLNSPPGSKGSSKQKSNATSTSGKTHNLRDCFQGHELIPTEETEVYGKVIKLDNGKDKEVKGVRRKRVRCKACKSKTSYFCKKCGEKAFYCQPLSKNGASCARFHKRVVEAEECKKIPGCSGWISYESNKW